MGFGEVLFPAKSRTEMRLLVHIPKQHRKRSYQIAVRQLWKDEEVGRVTWRLQRRRTLKELELAQEAE
jgi:hypothetical protein